MKASNRSWISWLVAGLAVFAVSGWTQENLEKPGSRLAQALMETQGAPREKAIRFLQQSAREHAKNLGLADLGARKARNAQLQAYCQQLQQHYLQANNQLQPLASRYGLSVQKPLTRKAQNQLTKLEALNSAPFDRALTIQLLQDQQQETLRLQRAAARKEPAQIRQYAQVSLPRLQQQTQEAVTIAQATGVDAATVTAILHQTPRAVGGSLTPEQSERGTESR